jgi:hypothetical protein
MNTLYYQHDQIRIIRLAEHVERMWKNSAYKILITKPEAATHKKII